MLPYYRERDAAHLLDREPVGWRGTVPATGNVVG